MSSTITLVNNSRRKVLLKRNSSKSFIEPPTLHLNSAAMNTKNIKKKTVRFKDDNNIEHIRYFYKSQTPLTAKDDPPHMEWSSHDYKLSMPNWPSRSLLQFSDTNIRMENVELTEGDTDQLLNNELNMEGRCRVKNIAFEKSVVVRYSLDLWNTSSETTAVYRESIANTNYSWDRFTFSIPVKAKCDTQIIYFALKYIVGSHEFWDNNNGKNYEVVMTPIVDSNIHSHHSNNEKTLKSSLQNDQDMARLTKNFSQQSISNRNRMKHEDDDHDDEKLGLRMNNTTKDTTKLLGRRYDFGASLSAARKPLSPPPSPPASPVDLIHKRVDQYNSYTPSLFYNEHHQHYNHHDALNDHNNNHSYPIHSLSPNTSSTMNAADTHLYRTDNANSTDYFSSHQERPLSTSEPIPIHSSTIVNNTVSANGHQMSYSDFINKYCFYSPNHINNYSTSPSTVHS